MLGPRDQPMRRILLTVLFIAFFTALPSHARLGETEDQCIARYGTPTQVANPGADGTIDNYRTLYFSKGDYSISAAFLNGHCGVFAIQKSDKSDLSSNEIQILLDANSDGHTWKKSDEISVDQNWIRDDGCKAEYTTLSHYLVLMSKEILTDSTVKQKADEAQKLNGF